MSKTETLKGKKVLVTGASAGLGAETAIAFARQGASVDIVARRLTKLKKINKIILSHGAESFIIQCDLSDAIEINKLCKRLEKDMKGIDILVNNAGVHLGELSLLETSVEDWENIMNTNLRAPFLLCNAVLPYMQKNKYGRIVNIISATNTLVYSGSFRISKVGLELLTGTLANELKGSEVSVTAFNPGWMKTETSESGRSSRGSARAIVDLVQRPYTYLNGSVIDLVWVGRKYRLRKRAKKRL